jgi:hypothetical protein
MKNLADHHKILGVDPLREDRVVGILRPKKQPEIIEFDGLLQFKNENLFNPDLRNFECFLTGLLNAYAKENFTDRALAVSASLYLDPQKLRGFPLFGAWTLEGVDVDSVTVEHFRALISRITAEFTEQPSLFHQRDQAPLDPDTDRWLDQRVQAFRRKNSGKNYSSGFSIHLGSDDTAGMLVSGKLPLVENLETIREALEGISFIDGFTHDDWEIFLIRKDEYGNPYKSIFKISHQKNLKIASLAFLQSKSVRYEGYKTQNQTDTKPSYYLKTLEILDDRVDAEDGFELTE